MDNAQRLTKAMQTPESVLNTGNGKRKDYFNQIFLTGSLLFMAGGLLENASDR